MGELVLRNHDSPDEVFLNDTLEHVRGAGVIPRALRVHDRDRAVGARAKAVGLCPEHRRLAPNEAEFLQPFFQKRPRLEAGLLRATLRLALVSAKKNVALELFQPKRRGNSQNELGETQKI